MTFWSEEECRNFELGKIFLFSVGWSCKYFINTHPRSLRIEAIWKGFLLNTAVQGNNRAVYYKFAAGF